MITDYIFYRLYRAYKRKDDPPIFTTCCFLIFCVETAVFIIYVILSEWSKQHGHYLWFINEDLGLLLFISPVFLTILYCILFYREKRVNKLLVKYNGCLRNKFISVWMILCIPIYEILLGILIYYLCLS